MKSPRSYVRFCLATLTAVAAALLVGVQPAAANLGCGAVITQSTTLTHDLVDCPEDGIRIDASNVVLDLGGHTVDGINFGPGGAGVRVMDHSHTGITIKNGKVQEFGIGVSALSGNTVTGISATRNAVGIHASSNAEIVSNSLVGNIGGLSNNGSNSVFSNNQLHGNINSGANVGGSGNLFQGNSASKNGQHGFNIDGDLEGGPNTISHNQSVSNAEHGIRLFRGVNTVIVTNGLSSNGIDGLIVLPDATGTRVESNMATKNLDDGIDVDSPGTTIKANSAHVNGDHGIEAVPGVIDGGGNKATGNGNTNCVNVVCT